jgi:hypothetical protein
VVLVQLQEPQCECEVTLLPVSAHYILQAVVVFLFLAPWFLLEFSFFFSSCFSCAFEGLNAGGRVESKQLSHACFCPLLFFSLSCAIFFLFF